MNYQEVHGDLIQLALAGHFDVIAHGCNCFCRQKRGLAPQMVKAFGTDQFPLELKEREIPGSWYEDEYEYEDSGNEGDINKLGQIDAVEKYVWERHPLTKQPRAMGHKMTAQQNVFDLTVVNCYTQYHWSSPQDPTPLDYEALAMCLKKLGMRFKGQRIGLPQIGCGLAGGDWPTIKKFIQTYLKDCDVTVVIFSPTPLTLPTV